MMKMKNFALLSFLVLEFISVSSLIGSQPQGVELNPTGLSRISWMFETSQDDWVNTKSMGGDGHEGDDYYADDWARAAAGGLTGEQRTFGQIVYAGISGIAIVKPNHGDYGNDVIIYDSESTFALRNAHLSEILVNDGQEISAGSPIGKVGDSGNSYGSHLHIALYKNVQDVNDRPITWITFNRGDPPTIPGPPTDFAAPFLYNPRVTPIIIWDSEIANLTHTDPRYTNQEVALTMYVKNTGTQIGTFWFHMIVRQNGFLSDPVVFDQWEKVYDIGVGQTKSHIFSWTPTEDDEYRYEPEVWNVPIDVKYDSWVTEWYPVIDGNILPTISIISGPSGTINYDDVTFSWQGSDTDGKVNGYERMMDGVGASTIFTSEPFNNLPEGSHTFNVRCLDDDGAYSSWATRTFTVDTVLPPVPIISSSTHTEGVWSNNDDPSFSWIEPSDASGIIGYSYYFDQNSSTIPNTTSEGTSKSKGYSNAIDGTWYFHVRAKDGAGNWGSPDHYGPVKIDDTPPTAPISLTALPSDWTNNSVFSIGWTDPSDPSGIDKAYYKIDSAPSGPTDGIWSTINPFPAAATSEGGQAIYVWLMDGAGNLNHNNRDTAILYYDATSPSNPTSCTETHGVQSGVDQNTVNDPNFTWSGASDSASGIDNYYYYWGTNALGTSTTYTALAGYDPSTVSPGTYYLRLKTRDNAGNDASWTAVFTFIYSAPNDPPVIAGIPDQSLDENTSLDNAIDLWTYASDP
ncbi:MAG: M23 family metallopeptidase, partial [Chloroflexi bacterium]|nr:M23 family metallopeptidase [Chloroflexota bacterium]